MREVIIQQDTTGLFWVTSRRDSSNWRLTRLSLNSRLGINLGKVIHHSWFVDYNFGNTLVKVVV